MQSPGEIKELTLAGKIIRIREARDPEKLFDELLSLGEDHPHVKDERIPYWADLWPSAVGLATHLISGENLQGKEALEIGCGLGLPGIAAGIMGAEVTFTDYIDEALSCAKENWILNMSRPAAFEILDWRHPRPGLKTNLLLASDVAYEQRSFEPLLRFFEESVLPGGTILLSEPGRKYTKPWIDSIEASGYDKNVFHIPVTLKGIQTNVAVYKLIKHLN